MRKHDVAVMARTVDYLAGIGISEDEMMECFAGWGILDIPLIKDMRDIVKHGLHELGDSLNPKALLKTVLPFAVE